MRFRPLHFLNDFATLAAALCASATLKAKLNNFQRHFDCSKVFPAKLFLRFRGVVGWCDDVG